MKLGEVYILHITFPDGRVRHYIGHTERNRTAKRTSEHAKGKGSHYTRECHRQGAKFQGRILKPRANYLEEAFLQAYQPRQHLCPICSGNDNQEIHRLFNS